MTAIIEWLKSLGAVVGLCVLIELGLFLSIILFCVIREFWRKKNDHT